MQDVNEAYELHTLNGPTCVTSGIRNDLHHGRSVEALKRLGVDVFAAELRMLQGLTGDGTGVLRKASEILAVLAHEDDTLWVDYCLISDPVSTVRDHGSRRGLGGHHAIVRDDDGIHRLPPTET